MTLTFGTVPFTLFTFLHLVSNRVGDDNFLVGFGANQSTSHFHRQVVVYRQGDKVFKERLCNKKKLGMMTWEAGSLKRWSSRNVIVTLPGLNPWSVEILARKVNK